MPPRTESPPKRVTRSRAKAVAENKVDNKPLKITTQSAKATAARTTKRKTRVEDEEDELAEEEISRPKGKEPAEKPAPGRRPAATVSRKAASVTRIRAAPRSTTIASVKASTGRSKIGGEPEEEMATDKRLEPSENVAQTRSACTRTTSAFEAPSAAEPRAGRFTSEKKVTFRHDESDKENKTLNALSSRRAAAKKVETMAPEQIGTMARPVRGTAARGERSTRGGRAQANLRASARSTAEPLSPKKNAQVSVKVAEDREIQHAMSTPAKALQKSPVKPIPGSIHKSRELPAHNSPTKARQADDDATDDELQSSVALFTSPAKRLPPALQKSPTRGPESPKVGAFEQSPRKFATSLVVAASRNPAREHKAILLMPAMKFPMSGPTKQPLFDASKQRPDLERSMFKSPPKRPASPVKDLHFGSSVKPYNSSIMKAMTSSGVTGTPRKPFSPVKTVSSAFRASTATPKVHKMTPEEQAQMFEDELNDAPSPFASIRSSFQATPIPIKPGSKIPIRSPPRSPERTSERSDKSLASPLQFTRNAPRDENLGQSTLQKEISLTSFRANANDFMDEDDSEDELFANESRIVCSPLASKSTVATPRIMSVASPSTEGPMTALAERLGDWSVGTSDIGPLQQPKTERTVFSPLAPRDTDFSLATSPASSMAPSPLHNSHFELPIAIHEDEDEEMRVVEGPQSEESVFRQSQMSDASQEYGDENALPIDPSLLEPSQSRYFCTPQRTYNDRPQTMSYTVSKVPLKPAADDDTPQPKLARRGHSLSGSLSPQAELDLGMFRQLNPAASNSQEVCPQDGVNGLKRGSKFIEKLDETSPSTRMPSTPGTNYNPKEFPTTPARTPRPDLSSDLLIGTVVFVDVHTTEGADASGIFVELLAQMGAKCVKQWNWNSRSSAARPASAFAPGECGTDNVGITHVVFKDGGRRTMEKVREAKGAVLCVGVGWVLDCEKRNEWCNEADYAIDTSTIPRGGHRRRKSMEPKLLSSMTFSPLKPSTAAELSPTKEFLNLESPTPPQRDIVSDPTEDRRVSFATVPPPPEYSPQATPSKVGGGDDLQYGLETPSPSRGYDESTFGSPTTPYFLHPQELIQQTCPPKQTQQLFFPISGRIEDQPDEHIRQRLLLARRKSLQWAPRVASPLSRTQSYQ